MGLSICLKSCLEFKKKVACLLNVAIQKTYKLQRSFLTTVLELFFSLHGLLSFGGAVPQNRKALPGFFLCIFSSLTCLKKPVFSKWDLLQWKVPPARLHWDLLTSVRYQLACHYFLKVKKNLSSALLRRERT